MIKTVQSIVILELTKKLNIFFNQDSTQQLQINQKDDHSLVTEVDLFVSTLIKSELSKNESVRSYNFFSEEEYGELIFPAAILDPIDGTRELVKGIPECAVSLGLMHSSDLSDPLNYGWIFNPFSGFSLDSTSSFVNAKNVSKKKILGMVSRSEFERGYFNSFVKKETMIDITPRGSIAFKLGLLASGGCDFVVSLSPKNIWDIAGGTILCQKRNILLYQNGHLVKDLSEIKIQGILIWSPPELFNTVWECFKSEIK